MKKWIKAFRMRTLPLAFSSILMGGFIAYQHSYTNWSVLMFALLTTLFLQILSNLANDYGDFVKGTDNDQRLGPARSMQSGHINIAAMKRALAVFVSLSLISGISLVYLSFGKENLIKSLVFISIGIGAILAAIRYTVGKSAYGYSGFGDLFVFIFFGLVAVVGTYFLISHHFDSSVLMPASTLGVFSTAVLNLNNLRDHKNDERSGKNTIVVKMGFARAKWYHLFLLASGWVLFLLYLQDQLATLNYYLVLVSLPLFIYNIARVFKVENEQELDPELKKLALSITLFVLLFGVGIAL
jgi:1,4-dihydroxy-2-naphthoate octaprenyltransferase